MEAEFSQEQSATKSQRNGCGHGCSQFNAVLYQQMRFSVAPVIVKEGRSVTWTLLLQLHQNGHDMTEPLVTTWLWETQSYAQTRAADVTCRSAGGSWFPKSIKPRLLSLLQWSQARFLKSKSNVLFRGYFRAVWIILYARWFWWWYAFWKQLIRDLRTNLSSNRQTRKSLCVSSSHFFFPFSLVFFFLPRFDLVWA